MILDVIAFGAHPDDIELTMGGTVAKLSASGYKVGIIDLTRGEMGTRGSVELRKSEAAEAGKILNIAFRDNLGFPDSNIEQSEKNRLAIISVIRKYRPKIIFAPYQNDRHPDHIQVHSLIKSSNFYSGLPKIQTLDNNQPQEAHRAKKLFYYMQTFTFEPSFIVDISEFYEQKMASMFAYSSQFYDPKSNEPNTFISSPEFKVYIESRANFYGFQIGKKYGEPFFSEEKIELDPAAFL